MFPRPNALPRPQAATIPDINALSMEEAEAELRALLERHDEKVVELGILEKRIEWVSAYICGPENDMQHVEDYDGKLGVSRSFVDAHERAVGQLHWIDLDGRFDGPRDSPGDVSNRPWGTGALLDGNRFLTAGHCFDQSGQGRVRPSRDGATIAPHETATLMTVRFNFQKEPRPSTAIRPTTSFPVLSLLEYRLGGLDYAIVQLGAKDGVFPNQVFGALNVAAADLTTPEAMLCIIEHPHGDPKMIEAGPMTLNGGGKIAYNDIDTGGGASGAPILHPTGVGDQGEIVGVHTHGGCSKFKGANGGVSIGAIRNVSNLL